MSIKKTIRNKVLEQRCDHSDALKNELGIETKAQTKKTGYRTKLSMVCASITLLLFSVFFSISIVFYYVYDQTISSPRDRKSVV